ncbi:MAG: acyl-CoA thioesterase [Alphaproteobacteria bacterium]|nr:acyl-CoA thioesterase [Alphaproteobacteria bacterium]
MKQNALAWPVVDPFVRLLTVLPGHIDAFGHANNVRYVEWAMDIAWAHSEAVGLSFEAYRRLGAGCVVHRHDFSYVKPSMVGDAIAMATWIKANDGRVRIERAFEFRRAVDGAVVFRGVSHMVTIELESGRPVRMPTEFVAGYAVAAPVSSPASSSTGR